MPVENPDKGKPLVCFVVMGFGKKTAYDKDHKPRALDLDRTFEAIIKPAVEANGLRCVRADKMLHAGMIDTPMYGMLLHAEFKRLAKLGWMLQGYEDGKTAVLAARKGPDAQG